MTILRHALSVVAIGLASGCAEKSQVDPAARYTPEAVAQELVFRYQSLSADARVLQPRKKARIAEPLKGDELKKSGEAAKKEDPAKTAEEIVEQTGRTIRQVAPVDASTFCKKVADIVRKDGALTEKDRADLARRLDDLAGEL